MSDAADILGIQRTVSDEASKFLQGENKTKLKKVVSKPKGMSREVFSLLGKDGLAPAVQPNSLGPILKTKWKNSLKGKWLWAPIEPFSARK